MKKALLTLITIVAFAVVALGQTYRVSKNDHLVSISGTLTDQVSATGDDVVKIFDMTAKSALQYYTIPVYLDSLGFSATATSPDVAVYLAGSYDNDTYANIDTVSFGVTDADTTFTFSDLSTGTAYPYLRVTVTGIDSANVGLQKMFLRVLDK